MEITNTLAILVPVVLGLTQVVKMAGLSKRYIPLMSVFLGIICVSILNGFSGLEIIPGIIVGLSASGLYSGPKALIGK